jgi:hypothetical protein
MVWLEALSYIVTIFGLPLAIYVFVYEQRRRIENEEEALYQRLSDGYQDFLRLALENPDLQLLGEYDPATEFSAEQRERKRAIFAMLVSLFERAFITLYADRMNRHERRLWLSWEDFLTEWCRRPDFRAVLPALLEGEDDAFSRHILRISEEQAGRQAR